MSNTEVDAGGTATSTLKVVAAFSLGLASRAISAIFTSTLKPGVEVNSTSSSKSLQISTVCSMETLCGGASRTRESGSMPAGFAVVGNSITVDATGGAYQGLAQGAVFAIYASTGEEGADASAETPVGEFSWHELGTSNYKDALKFYSALFGWTLDHAGPMTRSLHNQRSRRVQPSTAGAVKH